MVSSAGELLRAPAFLVAVRLLLREGAAFFGALFEAEEPREALRPPVLPDLLAGADFAAAPGLPGMDDREGMADLEALPLEADLLADAERAGADLEAPPFEAGRAGAALGAAFLGAAFFGAAFGAALAAPREALFGAAFEADFDVDLEGADLEADFGADFGADLVIPLEADLVMPLEADLAGALEADLVMPFEADLVMPLEADLEAGAGRELLLEAAFTAPPREDLEALLLPVPLEAERLAGAALLDDLGAAFLGADLEDEPPRPEDELPLELVPRPAAPFGAAFLGAPLEELPPELLEAPFLGAAFLVDFAILMGFWLRDRGIS